MDFLIMFNHHKKKSEKRILFRKKKITNLIFFLSFVRNSLFKVCDVHLAFFGIRPYMKYNGFSICCLSCILCFELTHSLTQYILDYIQPLHGMAHYNTTPYTVYTDGLIVFFISFIYQNYFRFCCFLFNCNINNQKINTQTSQKLEDILKRIHDDDVDDDDKIKIKRNMWALCFPKMNPTYLFNQLFNVGYLLLHLIV